MTTINVTAEIEKLYTINLLSTRFKTKTKISQ